MLTKTDLRKIGLLIEVKFEEKFEEILAVFRNDVAQFKDEMVSIFQPLQEDHIALSGRVYEHSNMLENHDKRISATEHHMAVLRDKLYKRNN